jgi:hypothetical protein
MKIVNVVKNYLSEEKCNELNNWAIEAHLNNKLEIGITMGGRTLDRYTTRFGERKFKYPQLVRDLRKQIQSEFNLDKWEKPMHPHGRDGVVVSVTKNNGDVHFHNDPYLDMHPKHTLRCNILTSETEGGLIWVGDESYQLKKGDMMQYLVTKHKHGVEKVIAKENEYRIMWMFGWFVDGNEWEASIQ